MMHRQKHEEAYNARVARGKSMLDHSNDSGKALVYQTCHVCWCTNETASVRIPAPQLCRYDGNTHYCIDVGES